MSLLEFLAVYDTPRFVRVSSVRLGLLWWGLAFLALLYTGSSVFVWRSFRELEELEAFADSNVQQSDIAASCADVSGQCEVQSAAEAIAHREMTRVAITLSEKRNATDRLRIESTPVFKLDHAAFARLPSAYHVNGRALEGDLVDIEGRTMQSFGKGKADHVALATLLAAAGVNLDEPSDVPGEEGYSLRERGFHAIVSIRYSDVDDESTVFSNFWGRLPTLRYEVRVRRMLGSQFKWENGGVSKYAVVFSFEASGQRVVFAGWGSILTSLSHAITLITITSLLVDYLAIYILRESTILYAEKFTGPAAAKEKIE
jgi:hypothetical protein